MLPTVYTGLRKLCKCPPLKWFSWQSYDANIFVHLTVCLGDLSELILLISLFSKLFVCECVHVCIHASVYDVYLWVCGPEHQRTTLWD